MINISLIEQYAYCPRQAENEMGHVTVRNLEMERGSEAHEDKAKARRSFEKSRQRGKERFTSQEEFKKIIKKRTPLTIPISFVEVYVESHRYDIKGYIDEVILGNGKVVLIDYKTTFKGSDMFYVSSALLQIKAYAAAFGEFFQYSGRIEIVVKRAHLRITDFSFLIDPEEDSAIGDDGETIFGNGYGGHIKEEYAGEFNLDTDIDEFLTIVNQIKAKKFENMDNSNKCRQCQFNLSCNFCCLPQVVG